MAGRRCGGAGIAGFVLSEVCGFSAGNIGRAADLQNPPAQNQARLAQLAILRYDNLYINIIHVRNSTEIANGPQAAQLVQTTSLPKRDARCGKTKHIYSNSHMPQSPSNPLKLHEIIFCRDRTFQEKRETRGKWEARLGGARPGPALHSRFSWRLPATAI